MVRGRRVRAVVAYPRNDDCCSPHPKRKDQRAELDPKISRNILNSNKSITQFFQSVGVEIDYNDTVMVDDLAIKAEDKLDVNACILGKTVSRIVDNEDIVSQEVQELTDLNKTPISIDKKRIDIKSPPTPHRIELRSENESTDSALNANGHAEEQDVPPSQKMPPPKVKRRLKNNQINGNTANGTEKNNHKLTEYFPVRRSVRKTKKTVMEEKQRFLEDSLRRKSEDGLLVREFDGKGRGVIAARSFHKGDFVVEYSGELIDINEAKSREQKYAQDQNTGCYMYYFKHKNQQYCIDATAETKRIGRLVNHSRNGNLITRTVSLDDVPRLVLIAKHSIQIGEEITYDYGDRSKESLKHHPWLAF